MIVVIVIIGLITAITVAVFRGESPVRLMDRAALEFQDFCMRVRYQAMEKGTDRLVAFDPENKVFLMREASDNSSAETAFYDSQVSSMFQWKLPEEFEFDNTSSASPLSETDYEDTYETFEVFRFFPDGSASGKRRLVFQYKSITRTFEISSLTGQVRITNETEGGI